MMTKLIKLIRESINLPNLPEIGEAEDIVNDSDDIGRIKTLHHGA